MPTRIALFGGIYSNYLALEAALDDAGRRGVDAVYCLGDLGAFGPHPDRVFPLLREHRVQCVQGNYDDSVGNELADCQCGYTDPRDNHFAQISYDYTLANTSSENRRWLQALPAEIRLELGSTRLLLCHGSPRRTNEFLWESTTSTQFLEHLAREHAADVDPGHAHRHSVAAPAVGRPPVRQRRRPGSAGERRPHERLVRAAGARRPATSTWSSSRSNTITDG